MSGRGNPQYTDDFFVYVANLGNIAAGASAQVNIQIQADSDFEWIESTCYGNLNGTAEPIADSSYIPVTIQVTDSGSGRQLFQAPIPLQTIAGTGKQPFILPVPRLFMSKSNINVAATSFGAGTFNNIFMTFIGRKIFKLG